MKNEKIERMYKIEDLESIILELEQWEEGKVLKPETESRLGVVNDNTHRDTLIEFIKGNLRVIKNTIPDEDKMYLKEIIEMERPQFQSNNLILAPVGSGKTSLIEDILIKDQTGKILMLVSNTTLKNAVCPEDLNLRKIKANRMYTTQNKSKYGNESYEIHVMSYAEFGSRIKTNNDFVKNVIQIHCDEIHSLPTYQQYGDSVNLSHAIKYLFDKHDNQQIFYFTATRANLDDLERRQLGVLRNLSVFDYRNHHGIKRYMALSEYKINHIEQIRPHLQARLKSFTYFGYKCLAFNKTISGQKMIEQIAKEEGFTPLALWSINNNDENLQMTAEQLSAREILISTGKLPKPYNFLIINSAMQEGWNLDDNKVKLAIMNTTNETEHTQALGRLRGDVDILIYRANSGKESNLKITIPDQYLYVPLTTELKTKLYTELSLKDSNGRVKKWNSIKSILIESDYLIEDKKEYIDGKRVSVSFILEK